MQKFNFLLYIERIRHSFHTYAEPKKNFNLHVKRILLREEPFKFGVFVETKKILLTIHSNV